MDKHLSNRSLYLFVYMYVCTNYNEGLAYHVVFMSFKYISTCNTVAYISLHICMYYIRRLVPMSFKYISTCNTHIISIHGLVKCTFDSA